MKREIHSLTDLVTVRGSLEDGYAPDYAMSTWQAVLDGWLNVRAYGAVGDGITDDTAAITAAITAANRSGTAVWYNTAASRGVYLPPGVYKISSLITVPDYVQLRGSGARTSMLKATSAGSGVTVTGSSGHHGWFGLDGAGVGTTGLELPFTNECSFSHIEIRGWTTGLHCANLQNAVLTQVNCSGNGTGVVIDTQTNACIFLRCEYSANTSRGVYVPYTSGNVAYNVFDTCIIESTVTTLAHLEMVHGSILLRNCVIVGLTDSLTDVIVGPLTGPSCTLTLAGNTAITAGVNETAVQVNAAATLRIADYSVVLNGVASSTGVAITSSTAHLYGPITIVGPTTPITYAGGATPASNNYTIQRNKLHVISAASTDDVLLTNVAGDSFFKIRADGVLFWGPAGANLDTVLYRSAANELKTDDKLVIGTGVGVLRLDPIALPATCTVGELCVDTADKKLKLCTVANTWTIVGSQT